MSQTASTSPEGIINVPVPASKQKRKKPILLLGLVIIVSGISYFLWHSQRQVAGNILKLSGRIEGYETEIGVKRSGRIVSIAVREGAAVKRGKN